MDTLYTLIDRTIQEKGYGFDDIAFITMEFYGLDYMDDFDFHINEIDESIVNLFKQLPFDNFEEFCCKFIIMLKNGNWFNLFSIEEYIQCPNTRRPIGIDNIKNLIVNCLSEPKELI